jgi:hypothetical protein
MSWRQEQRGVRGSGSGVLRTGGEMTICSEWTRCGRRFCRFAKIGFDSIWTRIETCAYARMGRVAILLIDF